MNANNIVIIIILALLLYMFAGGSAGGSTGSVGGGDCVGAIQAQYAGQWAQMNQAQRAAVGLRAAMCEGGR
ncbi:MAG: hypothetical protein R3C14_54345 [Caldilineaceae bacterium]